LELKDVPEQVCQMTGLKDQNCAINQKITRRQKEWLERIVKTVLDAISKKQKVSSQN